MSSQFLYFSMVTKTLDILRIWWDNLKDSQKSEISANLGHLPSIMDFKVWPTFIEVITSFWDDKKIVFRFGDVEITPTLEEIKDGLDFVGMCGKRKKYWNHHVLLPDRPTSEELKNILLQVNANWLETHHIPLMRFFERWGHDSYFRLFPNELHNHSTLRQTQTVAFSACHLRTMVFPEDEGNEIDTRVVMVVDAMYTGIGRKQEEYTYCSLALVIFADIYRSLSLCKNGFPFFQGCNILLQRWFIEHLFKGKGAQPQELSRLSQTSPPDLRG